MEAGDLVERTPCTDVRIVREVAFEKNRWDLVPATLSELREIAAHYRVSGSRLLLAAHATEDELQPEALAARRADAVLAELTRAGIKRERIRVDNLGTRGVTILAPSGPSCVEAVGPIKSAVQIRHDVGL